MTVQLQSRADVAVNRGIGFLAEAQRADGAWQDFMLPVGPAEGWVTALIARLLVATGTPSARRAAEQAGQWLEAATTRRWSYNAAIPPDCDSTAWAGLALDALGRARGADAAFLRAHQHKEGGFSTYIADDAWGAAHCCVTPVALLALGAADPRDEAGHKAGMAWLRQHRCTQGAWPGYWWVTDFYPTLMAATCLTRYGPPGALDVAQITRAPALATARSALDLACLLLLLSLSGRAPGALIDRLRAAHLPDGSWPASRCLRVVPHWVGPSDLRAGGAGRSYADIQRCVTTAFAVTALAVANGTGTWL